MKGSLSKIGSRDFGKANSDQKDQIFWSHIKTLFSGDRPRLEMSNLWEGGVDIVEHARHTLSRRMAKILAHLKINSIFL